jgi:hypothetical protein
MKAMGFMNDGSRGRDASRRSERAFQVRVAVCVSGAKQLLPDLPWTLDAPFAQPIEGLRLITPAEPCSDARSPQIQTTATSRAFNPFEREIM